MRHKTVFALWLICIIALANSAHGQFSYHFVQDSDQAVLATLELSGFPATHREVVGLTFSSAGEELLGFGPVYQGSFDLSAGHFLANDAGGLYGLANMSFGAGITDEDPPLSSVPLLKNTRGVALSASTIDTIMIGYFDEVGSTETLTILGTWQAVPEPTADFVCFAPIVIGIAMNRRRRRK